MSAIASEIERFNRLSASWWNPIGPMRPLHVVNALRLQLVLARLEDHFKLAPGGSLAGLRILDVGCGGGLLAEPLAKRGAQVVGVDASPGNVAAAQRHAAGLRLEDRLEYRLGEVSDVLQPQERFDLVLALEVVEHVDDVPAFMASVAQRVAPGGLLMASTIDRSWKSFLFAIVGAEYLLRVLPRGTHQWRRFVRPNELRAEAERAGLQTLELRGMRYLPVLHRASWCRDTRVNYHATFACPLARLTPP